jgi:heat shock protein beta
MQLKRMSQRLDTLWFLAVVFFLVTPALLWYCHAADDATSSSTLSVDADLKQEKVALKSDDNVIQNEENKISDQGFSIADLKVLSPQKHQFQAEIDRLMGIIVNSLYSNRDIFLREVVSNASDALDKIRYLSLTDKSQLGEGEISKLEIRIKPDPENNMLHIRDTGIGMTKEQLINDLGRIAKSGTREFVEKLQKAADLNQIGQFGVGFYSTFLVADRVIVTTKHNEDKQYIWVSSAENQSNFEISEDPRGNTLGRGTLVSLHLKEDAKEYLDPDRLKELLKKYSEFINFPIYLWTKVETTKEVPVEEEKDKKTTDEGEKKAEEATETKEKKEQIEVKEETEESEKKEEEKPKTKTVKEVTWKWELINQNKPLWTRRPSEITKEEYIEFYKNLSRDTKEPLTYTHFKAEGDIDFTALVYVPKEVPVSLFERPRHDIKLYVKRVFITDKFDDILPKYLSFVKGVVDSDDLPLNISREMLQHHKNMQVIKKKLVRKIIAMFQQLEDDEEKFEQFYKVYSSNIKLGIIEDALNRSRLSKLLRFYSYKHQDKRISLQNYVDEMKPGQRDIYYLGGESKEAILSSPLLERITKRGYDVIFMTDPLDEYFTQFFNKFDEKFKLVNLGKEEVKFDDEEEKIKELKEKFKPLTDYMKEKLGSKVVKVTVSSRLTKTPCALVSASYGYTANQERIIRAQALADERIRQLYSSSGSRIMEVNPFHPLTKRLLDLVNAGEKESVDDTIELLYDTALLHSGFSVQQPQDFATRVHRMLAVSLKIDPQEMLKLQEELDKQAAPEAEKSKEKDSEQQQSEANSPKEKAEEQKPETTPEKDKKDEL